MVRARRSAGEIARVLRPTSSTDPSASAEDLQAVIYDVGRTIPRYQDFNAKNATPERPGVSNAWFGAIYQVLLGEEKGPRFGSFVQVYGISETRALIDRALKGELLA